MVWGDFMWAMESSEIALSSLIGLKPRAKARKRLTISTPSLHIDKLKSKD